MAPTKILATAEVSASYAVYPLLLIVITITIWGINPIFLSPSSTSSLVPFIAIYVVSYVGGYISEFIKIPKVVGMILSGILLANLTDDILTFNPFYSDIIRNISLTVLLVQAGIELDLSAIRSLSAIVIRLCFIPMIAEIIITSITSYYILGLPVVWSIMLGLILSAACAAIVVPNMIELKRQNLGIDKDIPTIVTCACSLDDVFAIAGFGITLGFAFSSSPIIISDYDLDNLSNESYLISSENISMSEVAPQSLTWQILKAPSEVALGIIIGTVYGYVIGKFPKLSEDESNDSNNFLRYGLLIFGACAFVFGSTQLDFPGAGPLGALVLAAVAGSSFKKFPIIEQNLIDNLDKTWNFFSIFLFSLIGSDIQIKVIDPDMIGLIVAVIVIGIFFRMIITYASLYGNNMNYKEKLFICIAWISKAAVQATVGPIALAIARSRCIGEECDNDLDVEHGKIILTASVMAVLICAPLASLGITFTRSRFLKVTDPIIKISNTTLDSSSAEIIKSVALDLTRSLTLKNDRGQRKEKEKTLSV